MKMKLILTPPVAELEQKLEGVLLEAEEHRADIVEISYGTHAGETKRRILNYLEHKDRRPRYSRLVKSKAGWGRVFVYFKWK